MYESTNDLLRSTEGSIITPNDETAFPIKMVQRICDIAFEKQWIILGGDIITPNFDYTYDNWYYEPRRNISLMDNVLEAIRKSNQYASEYVERHGECYLVVLTITSSYVEGIINT